MGSTGMLPDWEDNVGVLFVSSALFGAFLILFILSSLVLHHQVIVNKKRSSGPVGTTIYLTLGYLMFLIVSLGWILLWIIFTHPSLDMRTRNGQGWSVALLIANWTGSFALFVADWILMYRLYVIWDRKKAVLAAGGVMSLALAGVGVYEIVDYQTNKHLKRWLATVVISISLIQNITATSLIAWRVWSRNKLARAVGGQGVITRIIAILVESAALYTIWMSALLLFHFVAFRASHILMYGSPAVAGISTTLVNVRVGLGWATGEEGRSTHSLHNSVFIDPQLNSRAESLDED